MTTKTRYRIQKHGIYYVVIAPRRTPDRSGYRICKTWTWRAARKIADALNASMDAALKNAGVR